MIQLTRRGVVFNGTQEDLDSLRKKYDCDNYVVLPRVYEPALFENIMCRVEAAQFSPREHGKDGKVGHEFCMADLVTTAMLEFLASNPAFLRIIEHITGQPRIGEFEGRVYRLTDSARHAFDWHNDAAGGRVVSMSVNLSPQIYDGGTLQLNRCDSEEILQEIRNTGLGDAVLFRISRDLVHRVLGVRGDIPKTAFAGWFLQGEGFLPKMSRMPKALPSHAS